MTDMTPEETRQESPQENLPIEYRREGGSDPNIPDSEDARDPALVPPRKGAKKPAVKPAEDQEIEQSEVERGLDWADNDKRLVDRESNPST